jgi:hypothetical protein
VCEKLFFTLTDKQKASKSAKNEKACKIKNGEDTKRKFFTY